ncbi:aromatic-ring-hydroxylating dioxygenase subunit beta [Sphingobium yanoikuyae]|uniref:Anthranilate 1,2-dioxygenase n=2 Tax=Sphingomonadaceae TaxID=41297 RepID=A0A3G2UPU4_SPHYA|nr:aromatic-ring-hydroxylating dioxygenase subunit beta [Sphingobium yanoikuyae]AYO76012.1 anthranilate 1,2-dioxygenase [Sphingobium yanoikuyae]
MMGLPTLEQMQFQHAATQLNALHAELIDDDRLEEWPDLFEENCRYSVISAENHNRSLNLAAVFCDSRGMLVDRIVSLRRANIFPAHSYRHILGPTRVKSTSGQIVTTQTNYVVLMTRNDGQTSIYNSGKYVDQIDVSGAASRFLSKTAIFDTHLIDTMMVRPI